MVEWFVMGDEKVLGFLKVDGKKGNKHAGIPIEPLYYYSITEDKLIPVRLVSESVSLSFLEKKVRSMQGNERWCLNWCNAGAESYCEHDTEYFDTKEEALDKLEDLKIDFGEEMLEWGLEKKRKPEIDAEDLLLAAKQEAEK